MTASDRITTICGRRGASSGRNSSTTVFRPCSVAEMARIRPAGPAPTISTKWSRLAPLRRRMPRKARRFSIRCRKRASCSALGLGIGKSWRQRYRRRRRAGGGRNFFATSRRRDLQQMLLQLRRKQRPERVEVSGAARCPAYNRRSRRAAINEPSSRCIASGACVPHSSASKSASDNGSPVTRSMVSS